jgi:hypothetical protein
MHFSSPPLTDEALSTRASYRCHLNLMTLMLREEYIFWSILLCNFLHYLVRSTSSSLGPNILSTLFSERAVIAQWYSSGLRAGWSEVRVPAVAGNFSLHHRVQNGSEALPSSYPMGTGALSLGVKRPGREANHSPPSSAEVKNAWSCTSTPPICLHGVVLR